MAEEQKLATETLVKKSVTIELVDEDGETQAVVINTFSFGKTIRAFTLMSELAAVAGLDQVMGAATKDQAALGQVQEGEDDETPAPPPIATNFIGSLLEALPKLLRQGVPAFYSLLGLIVTGNKELKRLEKEDGIDVDALLREKGRDLAYDYDNGQVLGLIGQAVQVMGVETVVSNLAPLLTALRRR